MCVSIGWEYQCRLFVHLYSSDKILLSSCCGEREREREQKSVAILPQGSRTLQHSFQFHTLVLHLPNSPIYLTLKANTFFRVLLFLALYIPCTVQTEKRFNELLDYMTSCQQLPSRFSRLAQLSVLSGALNMVKIRQFAYEDILDILVTS